PALFVLALVARRQWAMASWTALAGILLAGGSFMALGWEVNWSYLVDLLPHFASEVTATPPSQTLASYFARLGWDTPYVRTAALGLSILIIALTLWRVQHQYDWSLNFALVTAAALVLPTRNWDFNYLLLLVPMVALYFEPTRRAHARFIVLLTYLLLVLQRYWLLFPSWWPLLSFSVYAAGLLWLWALRQTTTSLTVLSAR
ncbi:MAG: glycosyltransferase 87 family protein, partial [Chloroflexi bacterium]|nr:glycosyltransferase 87 family protein [Chloroflexota bacterium]